MRHPAYHLLRMVLLLGFVQAAIAEPWPLFRGPDGSAQSEATTIPATWTTDDYNWRVKLPGTGHSSPVILGNRVFVTCAVDQDATRIIRCLDTADGGLVWKQSFPSAPHSKHQFNGYASSTPAVDRDRVYTMWATPEQFTVLALDTEKGHEVWRRELGPFASEHGFGASPILFEDLLIVPNDQDGESFIVALDRVAGKTRWKAERRTGWAAFSTPCIFRPPRGKPQLILTSQAHGISALSPYDGKPIWEVGPFEQRAVNSPMIAGGLVFASCGSGGVGKQMFAVRPGNPDEGIEAEVAYELEKPLPYVCTPVAHGELLFLWFDKGIVTCLDAPTGKIHWQERVGGDFFGSPVRVADRIYCISRKGEVVVLAAAGEFELLGRIDLEEPSHSTPAIADGVMYLRTASHLMSIGGKP